MYDDEEHEGGRFKAFSGAARTLAGALALAMRVDVPSDCTACAQGQAAWKGRGANGQCRQP